MTKLCVCFTVLLISVSFGFGFEENIDYKKLSSRRGVSKIVYDEKSGNIKEIYVNGVSVISNALGATRGEEAARKKAELDARARLRVYIKDSLRISESSDGEGINVTQGGDGDEGSGPSESGKLIEKDSAKYKLFSEGMIRGLMNVHIEQDPEKKLVVAIFKIDVSKLNAIKDLDRELSSDKKSKKADRKIEKKSESFDP